MAKNRRLLSEPASAPMLEAAPQDLYWDRKNAFGMVAKEHWYGIMRALRMRDEVLTKEITAARKSMEKDDGTDIYRSLAYMLETVERMQRENAEIIKALTPAYEQLDR
jgi:hypothetical protein